MDGLVEKAKSVFGSFVVANKSEERLTLRKLKCGVYITAILFKYKNQFLEVAFDLSIKVSYKDILHESGSIEFIAAYLEPAQIQNHILKAEEEAETAAELFCIMNNAPLCSGLPAYLELYGFNQFVLDVSERRFDGTIFIRVNGQLFMLYQSDDNTVQITHDAKSKEFTRQNLYYNILHYLKANSNPTPPPVDQANPPVGHQLLFTLDRIAAALITRDGATR